MRNDNAIDVEEEVEESSVVEGEDKVKKKKKPLPPSIKLDIIRSTFYIREPQISCPDYAFLVPKTPIFDLFLEFLAYSGKKVKDDYISVERDFKGPTPSIQYQSVEKASIKAKIDFIKNRAFSFKFGMDLESYKQFNRDCFFAFVCVFHKLYLRFLKFKDKNNILLIKGSIFSFTAEDLGVSNKELDLLLKLTFNFKCESLNDATKNTFPKFIDFSRFLELERDKDDLGLFTVKKSSGRICSFNKCFYEEDGLFKINPWFLYLMFWTANLGYKIINRGFLSCNKLDIGCMICAFELCFNENFFNKNYNKANFFKDGCVTKMETKLPNTLLYLSHLKTNSVKNYSPLILRRKLLSYLTKLQDKGYFDFYISQKADNPVIGTKMVSVKEIDPKKIKGKKVDTAHLEFDLKDAKFEYTTFLNPLDRNNIIKPKSTIL